MRENCTSGSVRGASGNRGSYRKRAGHQSQYESLLVIGHRNEPKCFFKN